MSIIVLRLKEKNTEKLLVFAQEVHDKLLANSTIFTTPVIALPDFQQAIDALQAAQQETLMGGVAATIFRNEQKKILEDMLRTLVAYVATVAQGNPTIITKASMEVKRRGPQRYESIEVPRDLRAEGIGGGMVSLRWKPVNNSKAYEVEYCLDPITDNGWRKVPMISASKTIANGLTRKEEYWFRVRAIGSKGLLSDWCSPEKELVY